MNTNFYFTIDSAHLEPALDRYVYLSFPLILLILFAAAIANTVVHTLRRFAQFFISPTFDTKCMEKELEAIQSEFDLKFDRDAFKSYRVDRETCDQSHDFAKFVVGNKKTLKEDPEANGIDVRARLLQFYSAHYSANAMCLCVLGKASLDELYAMVIERLPFGEIENKKITPILHSLNLAKMEFRTEHLQVRCSPLTSL